MSALSIKVPTQKKSGNLFNEPCILGKYKTKIIHWFINILLYIYRKREREREIDNKVINPKRRRDLLRSKVHTIAFRF